MNRKIAMTPLMFVCLMLLAHLAVPHHHHHGTIICPLNYSDEIVAESHLFETHHHDADNNQEDTGDNRIPLEKVLETGGLSLIDYLVEIRL